VSEQPWMSCSDPFIAGIMKHLQCDNRCEIQTWNAGGDSLLIRHERAEQSGQVMVMRSLSRDHDDYLHEIEAALEPLKAQHWHELIANWVGEGVAA
jgi:hypothetical protein